MLPRYLSVTAEQIRDVARDGVPGRQPGRPDLRPDRRATHPTTHRPTRSEQRPRRRHDRHRASVAERPDAGRAAAVRLPARSSRTRLANGLRAHRRRHLPGRALVTASLVLRAARPTSPPSRRRDGARGPRADRGHRAPRRDRADRGRRAARRVAPRRGRLGRDVRQRRGPGERLAPALELLAEVAAAPTFPGAEVERLRDERLNDLLQAKADPRRRADEAFVETIYAPSARTTGRRAGARRRSRRSTRARSSRAVYERDIDPARAAIVVGGDLEPDDVDRRRRGACSAAGRGARRPRAPGPIDDTSARHRAVRPRRPPARGSVQTEIRVGHVGAAAPRSRTSTPCR